MSIVHVELYETPEMKSAVAMFEPGTMSGTNGPCSCRLVAKALKAPARSSMLVAFSAAAASSTTDGFCSEVQPARRPTFPPAANGRKLAESA